MTRSPNARKTKAYVSIAPKPAKPPSPARQIPTSADIEAALQQFQPQPPAPSETWRQALMADCKFVGRVAVHGLELCCHAGVAVASPLLTAMVDGIAIVVFALTAWDFWRLAKPIADALADKVLL